MPPNIFSNRSNFTSRPNSKPKLFALWTLSQLSSKVPSQLVSPNESSPLVSPVAITSWPLFSPSRKATTQNNTVCPVLMARIDVNIQDRSSCKRDRGSRSVSQSRCRSLGRWRQERRSCTKTSCTRAMRMSVRNIPKTLVSRIQHSSYCWQKDR